MTKRLLDLYCCQGGASRGYADAGFTVYGVDIDSQPRYPYPFRRGDVIDVLRRLLLGEAVAFATDEVTVEWLYLTDFDAIHASPPCQLYSLTQRIMRGDYPDLIGPTRALLIQTGLPYVIENVMEARAELVDPIMLCGATFGLETYRHRLFESSLPLRAPGHIEHVAKTTKMGRAVKPGEFMHVVGNFTGVDKARDIMRMPWANRDGLREAIPPAYSEHLGRQVLAYVDGRTPYASQTAPWWAEA